MIIKLTRVMLNLVRNTNKPCDRVPPDVYKGNRVWNNFVDEPVIVITLMIL